ncbi:plasmid partitioning protein RepB [compost metagenome]
MAIGALLGGGPARQKAEEEIGLRRFLEADSDRRFQLVFARLSRIDRQDPAKPEVLTDESGRAFAKLKRDGKSARIEFSPDVSPAFVDEAIELLAKHHAAFLAARQS